MNSQEGSVVRHHIDPMEYYVFERDIGTRGDGSTKLVKHKESGELRVLNTIKKEEGDLSKRVELLKKLNNKFLSKVLEIYVSDDSVTYVNRYFEAGDLGKTLPGVPEQLNIVSSSFVVYQILYAIKYLHSLNIVHRGIKPENLLITREKDFYFEIQLSGFRHAEEVNEVGVEAQNDIRAIGLIFYLLLTKVPGDNSIYDKIKAGEFDFEQSAIRNPKHLKEPIDTNPLVDLLKRMLETDASKGISANEAFEHEWFRSIYLQKRLDD